MTLSSIGRFRQKKASGQAANASGGSEALGHVLEMLDLTVVALMQHVVVAPFTAMVMRAGNAVPSARRSPRGARRDVFCAASCPRPAARSAGKISR
jgi:hypothetical protein